MRIDAMTTTEQSTKTALWVPGWYELDQPLTVGVNNRFWFYQNPPTDLPQAESVDFVFYNEMTAAANCQVRTATIISIHHSVLGQMVRIDTDGLDYVFYPESQDEIMVNAEENPGSIYDNPLEITDWSVTVTMNQVSEPVSDFV